MRLLLTNDDGPPDQAISPFIASFAQILERESEYDVHVVLPNAQRSWIGKAHFPFDVITATTFRPSEDAPRPWTLLNGSPACCVQIGVSHLIQSVDVVIAGPNHGCNISSIFALSSGTIGAAMEGASLERKSIALSYEYGKEYDPVVIEEANRLSVRIIRWLLRNWDAQVAVYNVNVPLRAGMSTKEVYWTKIMDNYWSVRGIGCAYSEEIANADADEPPQVRMPTPVSSDSESDMAHPTHRVFKWAPTYGGLWDDADLPGSDAWSIKRGHPSITALKANLAHVDMKAVVAPIAKVDG